MALAKLHCNPTRTLLAFRVNGSRGTHDGRFCRGERRSWSWSLRGFGCHEKIFCAGHGD